MVAVPLLFGSAYAASGLREAMPPLYTIMILQIAIAPITSSAAFAALMGLDVAFSLATLIVCNALSPLTTVAFSYLFLGTSLISPIDLGIKLLIFLRGVRRRRLAIRGIAGAPWIERQKRPYRRPQRDRGLHLRHRGDGRRAAPRDGRPAVRRSH